MDAVLAVLTAPFPLFLLALALSACWVAARLERTHQEPSEAPQTADESGGGGRGHQPPPRRSDRR